MWVRFIYGIIQLLDKQRQRLRTAHNDHTALLNCTANARIRRFYSKFSPFEEPQKKTKDVREEDIKMCARVYAGKYLLNLTCVSEEACGRRVASASSRLLEQQLPTSQNLRICRLD